MAFTPVTNISRTTAASATLAVNGTHTMTVQLTPAAPDHNKVMWYSLDSAIASVSSAKTTANGSGNSSITVTGKAKGQVMIVARNENGTEVYLNVLVK